MKTGEKMQREKKGGVKVVSRWYIIVWVKLESQFDIKKLRARHARKTYIAQWKFTKTPPRPLASKVGTKKIGVRIESIQ